MNEYESSPVSDIAQLFSSGLLPQIEDRKAIEAIAALCGLTYDEALNLLKIAISDGLDPEEFQSACSFLQARKDKNKAIEISREIAKNRKVCNLIFTHQKLVLQENGAMDGDIPDENVLEWIEKIILGTE